MHCPGQAAGGPLVAHDVLGSGEQHDSQGCSYTNRMEYVSRLLAKAACVSSSAGTAGTAQQGWQPPASDVTFIY